MDRVSVVRLWTYAQGPGDGGTLGALPLYLLVRPLGLTAVLITAVVATAVAVIASSTGARISGLKDPQFVCVDEVAGVLFSGLLRGRPSRLSWWGSRSSASSICGNHFAARNLEKLPGGFGIVMDDVAAGCWGAVVLVLLGRLGWV